MSLGSSSSSSSPFPPEDMAETADYWWWINRKRASKRFKSAMDLVPSGSELPKPVTLLPFDLNKEQAVTSPQGCEIIEFPDATIKDVEEGTNQTPEAIHVFHGKGFRSKKNLTEAEKEAQKLRRVLANRESARQTIRHKQAFYEELNKKAINLASENENLKKDKEFVMKEYESLKVTNKDLKKQIAQKFGINKEEKRTTIFPTNEDTSTQPNPHFFVSKETSPIWQTCVCSQLLLNQANSLNSTIQGFPWWVIQYPLFLPIPSFPVSELDSFYMKAKLDQVGATDPCTCQHGNWITKSNYWPNAKAGSLTGSIVANASPATGQAQQGTLNLGKKEVDFTIVAAPVARKRRIELTKLKNLHCRPARGRFG